MKSLLVLTLFATFILSSFATANGQTSQKGYYPYVIARGQDREMIRSMPIEQRPTRPLHIYGNMVRRTTYRPPITPIANLRGRSNSFPRRSAEVLRLRHPQQVELGSVDQVKLPPTIR